jgi:hypothetical protein
VWRIWETRKAVPFFSNLAHHVVEQRVRFRIVVIVVGGFFRVFRHPVRVVLVVVVVVVILDVAVVVRCDVHLVLLVVVRSIFV